MTLSTDHDLTFSRLEKKNKKSDKEKITVI